MEKLSKKELEEIKIGLENIKQGKVESIEKIAKDLGIVLNRKL
ncbi:MAG: hypothetical protein AABX03_01700 [Nanoarchaeota archaeon]